MAIRDNTELVVDEAVADPDHVQIEYNKRGQLKFNPAFHPNQDKPFNEEEKEYLCMFYKTDTLKSMSMALGRTEGSVKYQYDRLSKLGLVEYHRRKYMEKLELED